MKIFDANISCLANDFLKNNIKITSTLLEVNDLLYKISGIINFFETEIELEEFKNKILNEKNIINEPNRTEYGDFQTNKELANAVVNYLVKKVISPEILIEPTCGKGNFIIASLGIFTGLKHVYGIEIYKPYIWETKFGILDFYLNNPLINKPEINIIHYNVFDFEFKQISEKHSTKEILIIGNPPWVTNAKLGSLNSNNLPEKSNFKKHSGLDAMTGKGNFDIAEYITLMMLDTFQFHTGNLVFLVKSTVIKNVVSDQRENKYKISCIEKQIIDAKKEFNVSVEAALFFCKLNTNSEFDCNELDFYNSKGTHKTFGWIEDKFVSDKDSYTQSKDIDGECSFEWRQGLKHDCSSIMELDKVNGHYINGNSEQVMLEDNLVYGLLKSSDLKNTVINNTRKYTIVTQKKVGDETNYIKHYYPKTFRYLQLHQNIFDARKSSIYKNKPLFSIFGIGDYSFKPYKVAISGFYKTFHFTLILPLSDKPLMLDDTCYFLGFDSLEFAVYTSVLLNSDIIKKFLQSITFSDAKRTFTKDVLMRIDLQKLATLFTIESLEKEINALNEKYNLNINLSGWNNYISEIALMQNIQTVMFA